MNNALEIIEAVDKFSGRRLKEKKAIEFLLSVAIEKGLLNLIEDIAFHSKFLWRLLSFVKSGRKFDEIDEESYKSRVTEQVNESVEKIRSLIFEILEKCSDVERKDFSDKFLKIDSASFENFLNLVHDFYWFKNWQIDKNEANEGA